MAPLLPLHSYHNYSYFSCCFFGVFFFFDNEWLDLCRTQWQAKEVDYNSQLNLMIARIQDLTTKMAVSDKQVTCHGLLSFFFFFFFFFSSSSSS